MKTLLVLIALLGISKLQAGNFSISINTPRVQATYTTQTYISYSTERVFIGYDCNRRPVYRYVRVPVVNTRRIPIVRNCNTYQHHYHNHRPTIQVYPTYRPQIIRNRHVQICR